MENKLSRMSLFLLMLIALAFLFPLIITVTNSFMSEEEISLNYDTALSAFDFIDGITERFIPLRLIPREATLSQYHAVLFEQPMFLVLLLNSIRITAPVVFGSLAIALLSAYGFTIWQWKHKEILFFIYVVVMLMPLQAVLVPNFIVANWLGINQGHSAIIMPGIFAPFGTFLLRQVMKGIPESCFEAACIDGAGELSTFLFIILPQMKSGIAALAMLTFIEYWNVVEQAVIFLRDFTQEPLSVFLSRLSEGYTGLIFAASVIYMVLPLLGLLLGQKHLEKGIELSGLK